MDLDKILLLIRVICIDIILIMFWISTIIHLL